MTVRSTRNGTTGRSRVGTRGRSARAVSSGRAALHRAGPDQQDASDQVGADQFHGAAPGVATTGWGLTVSSGEQRVELGNEQSPPGVAPEDGVERERPTGFGEEPLRARLSPEAASQQRWAESRSGSSDRCIPWRAKSAFPTLSGPYSKRTAKMSFGPIKVTAPSAEISHVGRQRERGEMRHRVRRCRFRYLGTDEDSPLESVRQRGADAVGAQPRHSYTVPSARSTSTAGRGARREDVIERRRVEAADGRDGCRRPAAPRRWPIPGPGRQARRPRLGCGSRG